MTKFAIVDPLMRKVRYPVEVDDLDDAKVLAGLQSHEVDHGVVWRDRDRGLAYVVHEHGFFVPPEEQHYFALGERLYAGAAVFYGFDDHGATADIQPGDVPPPRWFYSPGEIERMIAQGEIARPRMTIAGRVVWQWPGPKPEQEFVDAMLASILK